MLNIQALKINPFTEYLVKSFERTFGTNDQEILNFLRTATSISLENIANGDMLYHNVDHTIMVASVGSEIIRGKHLYEGGFCAEEGLAFLLALLCHDVGYVKGVCRKDDLKSNLFEDGKGKRVTVSPTGTCALLSPFHVGRSQVFVREHFYHQNLVDLELVCSCIERTQFPVPRGKRHQRTSDLPGLTRAADLIGQLGDPEYLRKIPALFYEFEELEMTEEMGYCTPGELRNGYAPFFWEEVHGYIEDAMRLLQITQEGKEWISRLHSHIFECEHYLRNKK